METRFLPSFGSVSDVREFINFYGNRVCPPANLTMRILEVVPIIAGDFTAGSCCTLVDQATPEANIINSRAALRKLIREDQQVFAFKLYLFSGGDIIEDELAVFPGALVRILGVGRMMILDGLCVGTASTNDVFYL